LDRFAGQRGEFNAPRDKSREKDRKKIRKLILKVLGALLALNILIIAIGTILHTTYFERQYEQIEQYGKLVSIGDGKMHVYSMGSGARTIVLLPGMGVALPSAEFGPLMRALSEKYRVVSLEYFGVGFSSTTSRDRTCENYVEEIRSALKEAQIPGPYILMPHSISSVYSEYYAGTYPDEIEAIISLDGTSTAYYEKMPKNIEGLLKFGVIQQKAGITSMLAKIISNRKDLLAKNYTEKEIDDMVVFIGFSLNETIIRQIAESAEFVKQTMDLKYPESVPFMKIISKQTYETPNKQLKISPQEYQMNHLARIGNNAKYEVLEGNHFIYLNNARRISEITDRFLREVDSRKSAE